MAFVNRSLLDFHSSALSRLTSSEDGVPLEDRLTALHILREFYPGHAPVICELAMHTDQLFGTALSLALYLPLLHFRAGPLDGHEYRSLRRLLPLLSAEAAVLLHAPQDQGKAGRPRVRVSMRMLGRGSTFIIQAPFS